MARISSGTIVAGLTAAALAVVGVLAVQASGSAPLRAGGAPGPSASAHSAPPHPKKKTYPLPAGSGTGLRVVYSLGQDRVWLVNAENKTTRTYKVTPGTVDPLPGTYPVTSRTESGIGGDGVAIEHVVRFATSGGVVVGFSAARDGSLPTATNTADATRKTGGIRETRADGAALWEVAVPGTKVVVVR